MELNRVFSDYRHEWATGDFNNRFVKPPYYDQILGYEPVFLVGGRGTGKTVTLRSLNFRNTTSDEIRTGIYVKAFKNRVEAFSSASLDPEVRARAFEHYMNLLCCLELIELCIALPNDGDARRLANQAVALASAHFEVKERHTTPKQLRNRLRQEVASLSAFINDPFRVSRPRFSHGELPVVELAADVHDIMGCDRPLYVCIDEWENLSAEQQQVLNRWIKNCERPITYKIGVREGGIKTLDTGGSNDPLHMPADYIETRTTGREMKSFCLNVIERRLQQLNTAGEAIPSKLDELLESLDRLTEADQLGVRSVLKRKMNTDDTLDTITIEWLNSQKSADAYLVFFLAERTNQLVNDVVSKVIADPRYWRNVRNNYGHLSLFSITRGMRGSTRQKFYAGAKTFLALSGGNVRYLLELVNQVLLEYSNLHHNEPVEPIYKISAGIQTNAAISVAQQRLRQIQALSERGLEVFRLVVILGTAFEALVREPQRSAPERTAFTISGDKEATESITNLLNEGCAILAFERNTKTKRTSVLEPREYEYRIHPLLTPHFCIPYRKKRRSEIDASTLVAALNSKGSAQSLVRTVLSSLESESDENSLFK